MHEFRIYSCENGVEQRPRETENGSLLSLHVLFLHHSVVEEIPKGEGYDS